MVYNHQILLKMSPFLVPLLAITGYFQYETYRCTQDPADHSQPTIVKDPIIVFPNCKWQEYTPMQDDYAQTSNYTADDYCAIKSFPKEHQAKQSAYCDAVFALGNAFSAITFTLLGAGIMLGLTPPAAVLPEHVAANGVVDWVNVVTTVDARQEP